MDPSKTEGFKSPSQKAKHVTEDWVQHHLYCLRCGKRDLDYVNHPVLDFACLHCDEKYELKSKKGKFGGKVLNSAYEKKIEAISSGSNPSFLFLQYELPTWTITDLFALPRHVFFPQMIARCFLLFRNWPQTGQRLAFLKRLASLIRVSWVVLTCRIIVTASVAQDFPL